MRKLTYGMNLSLDGYIAGPGDDLGWSVRGDELFQWWSDRVEAADDDLGLRRQQAPPSPGRGPGSAQTAWPAASASSTTSDPMLPVAPTTSTVDECVVGMLICARSCIGIVGAGGGRRYGDGSGAS